MITFTQTLSRLFVRDKSMTAIDFPSRPLPAAKVEIVIPVYNEAHSLPASIAALTSFLGQYFSYDYIITIVDNGSTDGTWNVARQLTVDYPRVKVLHLDRKGRGYALKQAWGRSQADILVYMDVDLSTDLSALEPLVTPLVRGEAAVATGSRLLKQSKVRRSLKREFISRCYNYLLRARLGFASSDAQCGFKAIRADIAKKLLPQIKDNEWFFDTELLTKASQADLRINEVAVTWREDADSRVDIVRTALDDLKGIRRVRRELRPRSVMERWAITAILGFSALLYGIGASQNGYANSFYAAAVQAGTASWKAFFFGSLDASNFITVDKPPVALWLMEISTRIFGFHSWSMLLPEVLAGIATVYLVYASVRHWFPARNALLAAAVMALTPAAVLMFGFNNPDAVLTMLLTASVYLVIRALDSKRPVGWLIGAAVVSGFAFNTKMLQGLIVVPVLGLAYLITAKPRLLTRVKHLLIALVFLAISVLWWPTAVSLWSSNDRPYIGSSTNNSVWDLILGYNGFGRLLGKGSGQGGMGGGGGRGIPGGSQGFGGGSTTVQTTMNQTATMPAGGPGGNRGGGGPGGSGFGGSTGVLRMFNSDFGPNIGWLLPAALAGVGYGVWSRRRKPRGDNKRAAYLLWGGFLALHITVFSMVSGVIHPYYVVVMSPAVAALVGMSLPGMVRSFRRRDQLAWLLPLTVAATGIVANILLGYQEDWLPWLRWSVLLVSLVAAVGLLLHLVEDLGQRASNALLVIAAVSSFVSPVLYALDTATVSHTGSIPTAGPEATGMAGSNNESAQAESSFVQYLLAHKGSARWLVAVASANQSAAIQITSGQPVMAVGGFNGSDDALSVSQLQALVASGQLRYYAVSSGGQGMGGGPGGGNSDILAWVKAHGTVVNYGGSSYTLYDLSS